MATVQSMTSSKVIELIHTHSSGTSVEEYNAKGDGTTDDTTAFNNWIANGGKHLRVPPGTYLIGQVNLNQAGQTIFLEPGAVLKKKSGTGNCFFEVQAANVTLMGYGATLDTNNQGNIEGSAIWCHAADFRCEGISFVNDPGIGVNCSTGGTRPILRSNIFTQTGNAAIFISAQGGGAICDDPVVEGNRVTKTSVTTGYGIQLHADTGGVINRPQVTRNKVSLPVGNYSQICIELFGGCVNGVVEGNSTLGGDMGISLDNNTSTTMHGNSIKSVYSYGVELASCLRCTVSGNTVDTTTGRGISLSNSSGGYNSLTGNTVKAVIPIYSQDVCGTGVTISGNFCYASGAGAAAIVVANYGGHSVTGNVCFGTSGANIAIQGDNITNSLIAHNTATDFTDSVVGVYNGSMNKLLIGPNVARGSTPAELSPSARWTPGTNGAGSQFIPANVEVTALPPVEPRGARSVSEFGATGDGTTDDTAAINSAIAYLNSIAPFEEGRSTKQPVLFFPPGRYRVRSALTPITRRGLHIVGSGPAGSQIWYDPTSNTVGAVVFDVGTFSTTPSDLYTGVQDITFEDIRIEHASPGTASSRKGQAIRVSGGGGLILRNVAVMGFAYGFNCPYGGDFNLYDNTLAEYCDVGYYLGPGSQQISCYAPNVFGCVEGWVLDRCDHIHMTAPVFNSCALSSITIEAVTDTSTRQLTSFNPSGTNYGQRIVLDTPWFESGAIQDNAYVNTHYIMGNANGTDRYRGLTINDAFITGPGPGPTKVPTSFVGNLSGSIPMEQVRVTRPAFAGAMTNWFYNTSSEYELDSPYVIAGYTKPATSDNTSMAGVTASHGSAVYAPRPSGADDLAALNAMITSFGYEGGTLHLHRGEYQISNTLVVPNKIMLVGEGRSATHIKAMAGFPTSTAVVKSGPTGSGPFAFGTRVEKLSIDCNNITGSIGFLGDRMQEDSGLRDVVISNFKSYGIRLPEACDAWTLSDLEIYPSATGATAGILAENSQNNPILNRITVGVSGLLTVGVRLSQGHFTLTAIHAENCTDGILFENGAVGTVNGVTAGTVNADVTNLIRNGASTNRMVATNITRNSATHTIRDDFYNTTFDDTFIQSYVSGTTYVMGFSQKGNAPLGFFGATPATQGAALTAMPSAAPAGGTGVAAGAWSSAADRDAAINTINGLRTTVNDLIARLQALGLIHP